MSTRRWCAEVGTTDGAPVVTVAVVALLALLVLSGCAATRDITASVDLAAGTATCGDSASVNIERELADVATRASLGAIARTSSDPAVRARAEAELAAMDASTEAPAQSMYVRTWPDGRCEAGTGPPPG